MHTVCQALFLWAGDVVVSEIYKDSALATYMLVGDGQVVTRYTKEPDDFRVRSTVEKKTHTMADEKRARRRGGGRPFKLGGKDF